MSYRYTNTDKWCDAWYCGLKPLEKLLFNYLCDKCDIGGFIEVITKNWASDIGETEVKIKGALKGLSRGLIYSNDNLTIYLRTFLRHQKNLPLMPEKNPAHLGISKRFALYQYKFDIQDINDFIERGFKGASLGLGGGIGNGNGIGNEKLVVTTKEKTWVDDYNIYIEETKLTFRKLSDDPQFTSELSNYYPGIDVQKSMAKSFRAFWGTEKGWRHKKKEKIEKINWRATLINSLQYNAVKL